jgi:6-phospho-beta-glucosidase
MRKVTIIGGGGVRSPLLIYGLAQARETVGAGELCLYDPDAERAEIMAKLGGEIVRRLDGGFTIRVERRLEEAAAGADYVLNSARVGGMGARARDERITIEQGLAGQETTGPGGAAMGLRTLPVTLAQARVVERVAPGAWFINFTNPAGMMTQALTQNTGLRVIGICDTPSELFWRISEELRAPLEEMEFDYAGLNHLGWVRRVRRNGEDVTERILGDLPLLRRIYPAELFDPEMIATLRLIPTEYLFFYYSQQRAYRNQVRAGMSRGEELQRMNSSLFERLAAETAADGLETYRRYLLQRNSSYLKLEAEAGSAFRGEIPDYNVFETATGYHRIALDVMAGLASDRPRHVVLNVRNDGAIEDLEAEDVVEVPCEVDRRGARARRTGALPEGMRGLVIGVKEYERALIRASLAGSARLAKVALMHNPIVGQWEVAGRVLEALIAGDREGLGYLR